MLDGRKANNLQLPKSGVRRGREKFNSFVFRHLVEIRPEFANAFGPFGLLFPSKYLQLEASCKL